MPNWYWSCKATISVRSPISDLSVALSSRMAFEKPLLSAKSFAEMNVHADRWPIYLALFDSIFGVSEQDAHHNLKDWPHTLWVTSLNVSEHFPKSLKSKYRDPTRMYRFFVLLILAVSLEPFERVDYAGKQKRDAHVWPRTNFQRKQFDFNQDKWT